LLRVTRLLTKSQVDIAAAFRVMVFNILAFNRDDHVKNFSYLMDQSGDWHFAPAYDLTFSVGPGGEHSMTVAGEGRAPDREHVLKLAEGAGVEQRVALRIIDEVRDSVSNWKKFADIAGVGRKRIKDVDDHIRTAMKWIKV